MIKPDEGYKELLTAVRNYLEERRKFTSSGNLEIACAHNLHQSFKSVCPDLEGELSWEVTDSIYAKQLIEYSLKGLSDPVYYAIWKQWLLDGHPLKTISLRIGFSDRNVRRFILKLPVLITEQLIEKNLEIINRNGEDPMTLSQHKQIKLMNNFGVTKRQAEILLEFYYGENLGQKVICGNLSLSPSGLKKHMRKIIRTLNVKDRGEALKKVGWLLSDNEPE